jgi:hypothetical protein
MMLNRFVYHEFSDQLSSKHIMMTMQELTFDLENNDDSESSKCEVNLNVSTINYNVVNGQHNLPQLQEECTDFQDILTYRHLGSLPLDDKRAINYLKTGGY